MAAMPFVSHARNGDDVLRWRALGDVAAGTYIDVGASHPERDSVTCAFYERGGSGVNIEPVGSHFERLRRARPRDVNLRLVVRFRARGGAQRGTQRPPRPNARAATMPGMRRRHRNAMP